MTVPQIYTLSPTSGLASGRQRVLVNGNYFRLPTAPSPLAPPGELLPTVSVTFNGREADLVAVLSSTRLVAVTPAFDGHPSTLPADVDLVITNLDDDGNPVPGESATLAGAFRFERPDLTNDTALTWISRYVLRDIRRNVIDNVAMASSPDWSDDPATAVAAIAELPAVLLEGPTLSPNAFYNYSDVRDGDFSDAVAQNASPFTADLEWDIILLARRKTEALNMCDIALRYFRRRPMFAFPVSPSDSTLVECRRFMGDWRAVDRFDDQVFAFESTLRLEALVFDDTDGMPVDEVLTYAVDETELNISETEDADA